MNAINKFLAYTKKAFHSIASAMKQPSSTHTFRIVSIDETDEQIYSVTVQLINTNKVFHMQPEEILADDSLTDSFSQRDIRTLTYLGYLGINAPKYKILAKRLLEQENQLVFALKERGSKKVIIKTAEQLSTEEDLISKLDPKDAHSVGYTSGTQGTQNEKALMKQLLENKRNSQKS